MPEIKPYDGKITDRQLKGLRVVIMPRRYDLPIIGRFLYWRLGRMLKKQMETVSLDDIVVHTGIPKDKWQGQEVGLRSAEELFLE